MKPAEPKWYEALKGDPLKTHTFDAALASEIRERAIGVSSKNTAGKHPLWRIGVVGILAAGLVLFAFQKEGLPPSKINDPQLVFAGTSFPLTFSEEFRNDLLLGKPKDNLRLTKNVSLNEADGLLPATLSFYSETTHPDVIHAYLENNGKEYEIGVITGEGAASIHVSASHWISQDRAEIQIIVPMIPQTEQMFLIRYNQNRNVWEQYNFQGKPTQRIDLEGDGKPELVSNVVNAVPPFVEVHRWNPQKDTFETAQMDVDAARMFNIDREKELTYTYLFSENGRWIIEFGTAEKHHFMEYKNGTLAKLELADPTSRLNRASTLTPKK